jgi:hypothetical protein
MNERVSSDREAYYFGYYPETPEGIPRKEQELREYLSSLSPEERLDFSETMVKEAKLLLEGLDSIGKLPDYLQSMPPALNETGKSEDEYDAQLREAWIKRIEDICSGYLNQTA